MILLIYIIITITIYIQPAESFTAILKTAQQTGKSTIRTPLLFTKDSLKYYNQINSPCYIEIINKNKFGRFAPFTNYKQTKYYINHDSLSRRNRLHSSKSIDATPSNNDKDEPFLDQILSNLTSAFPLFVLSAALLACKYPNTLQWVSTSFSGNLITYMLSSVMVAMGMTLETKDFENVLLTQKLIVPIGVMCQFVIMPILAFVLGKTLILPMDKALYLGFVLIGCVPGGTASNLVSLIAGADVALSVVLTSISTLLASFVTPLLVKLIIGTTVNVSGYKLFEATSKVVFLPVIIGMILNAKAPKLSKEVSRFTPFASVILVALICGGVVAQNALTLTNTSFLLQTLLSIITLHSLGFLFGYLIPRYIFKNPLKSCKTISIEVGMQNSALAVVLASSIGAGSIACLPGAISATVHSCLGSLLAAGWRIVHRDGDDD